MSERVDPEEASASGWSGLTEEAIFAPQEGSYGSVTVVRRGRRLLPSVGSAAEPPTAPDGLRRTPNVFRVELRPPRTPAKEQEAATGILIESETGARQATSERGLEADGRRAVGASDGPIPPKRRKRRRKPGVVTIIHPTVAEFDQASSGEAMQLGASGPSVQPEVAGARDMTDVGCRLDNLEYPKILSRIRELEAQAASIRKREVEASVAWILEAMKRYDLTLSDLGMS